MITYSNKLDMTPGGFPCVINLNQYDDDVELQFLLHSRTGLLTIQTGTTAMIRGTKRDGNAYSADATINVSSSTVTVAVTKQMTAAAGKNVFELVLLKGTKVLSTANFILQVEHAAMDADTVTSESVLKEMNALIESASTATAAAEEATEAAQSVSASAAQIEANRQAIAENASGIAANTTAVADLKDDLSDIEDEIATIEPGISDNAIVALLNCFQHVAWTDEDAQEYYDALEDALYESRQYIVSISATYVSSGHIVYPWDTLDSLKPYLTVTALYNDGTSQTIVDYMLNGTLDSVSSVITVGYLNKTTQVTVNVTIDSALIYYVPSGYVLDGGASSGFDTGVKLSDTNKTITIVFDATDEEILTRLRALFLFTDRDQSDTWARYQFNLSSSQSNDAILKKYAIIAVRSRAFNSSNLPNSTHRVKGAIIHSAGTNTASIYMNIDGNVECNFQTIYGEYNITSEQTLFVGKRPDGGYQWKGTINLFSIFSRALTVSEAKELLGVA